MKRIIKQVLENKSNGQLTITIPGKSGIKKDDYVEVTKVSIHKIKPKTKELCQGSDVKVSKGGKLIEKS